jgi:transcriptional regulator EpsA
MHVPQSPATPTRDKFTIDLTAFATFTDHSVRVVSADEFIKLCRGPLYALFPHRMLLAGVGLARGQSIVVYHAIGINYPKRYLERLKKEPVLAGPILTRWFATRAPQLFDTDHPPYPVSERWLQAVRENGIRHIAGHGVRDVAGPGASYFNFAGFENNLTDRHRYLLELVVPFLHQALTRIGKGDVMPNAARGRPKQGELTAREREILNWLGQGKTNPEIAQILDRSEFTVKNQVSAILQKLGVNSRGQAMSVALAHGWVPPRASATNQG